jgi:hypothetical protein
MIPTEPWDLVSVLGSGPFTGTVNAVGVLNQAAAVVFRLDQPLIYKSKSAQFFQASTRHAASYFAATKRPEGIFCNVASVSELEARNGVSQLGDFAERLCFLAGISCAPRE